MNKLALGTDFTPEEGAGGDEEAEQIKPDESQDEEKENSADDADSKTQDDSSESKDDTKEDDSKEDSKDSAGDDAATVEAKSKELQGLLGTEKALSTDVASLDEQITAARARISQKRSERREKRDLTQSIDSVLPQDENVDDLSDIDPETIKVLDRFTKAKGLVPKSELSQMSYQSAHKSAEEAFYESHPEYKPENDDNDILYNALKTELSLYSTPKDAKLIPKLFEKAHSEVAKLYPDKFKKAPIEDKKKPDTNLAAGRIKKQQIGGGPSGGSSGGKAPSVSGTKKEFSEVQVNALKAGGWSDEDIKRLTQ